MSTSMNRTIVVILRNNTGDRVEQGDVIVVNPASDVNSGIVAPTDAYTSSTVGVVLEPYGISDSTSGAVAIGGYVPRVNLSSYTPAAQPFYTWGGHKQAIPSINFVRGCFGQTLSNGNNPPAMLWGGLPDQKPAYARIVEKYATGRNGGNCSLAAWNVRTINTVATDKHALISNLSDNHFALVPGTYLVEASAPAYTCDRHKLRIYDGNSDITILAGTSEYSHTDITRSFVKGEFTATGSEEFFIQHYTELGVSDNGMGVAVDSGADEIYTIVHLWKLY